MSSEILKVKLEILRHGPAHNQPLSPLTNYLALCGNHGATSVRVPFEHRQFETRLRPLMYQESELLRQQQLRETSAEMREILQGIPGLIASLAEAAGRSRAELTKQRVVHLELILSASELALLPFELAAAPAGCPGAGEPLITQSQLPLCLTRRVRLQNIPNAAWNRRPRILFAAAAPGSAIPIQEHCDAFVEAVNAWVDWSRVTRNTVVEVYGEHLTVLPQASLQQIEQELSRALEKEPDRPYTHVHLLAHGVLFDDAGERRYGLAMHDPLDPDKTCIVRAQELAVALRAASGSGSTEFSCPTVVTLASCQGAAQGDVLGAGASIAHTLHEAGLPLVVASQFPLTFDGSVELVRVLYRGFLRGHDPRILLTRLRRQLLINARAKHDWASIVVYAAFSPGMDAELAELRYRQARRSVEMALEGFDRYLPSCSGTVATEPDETSRSQRFGNLIRWLESASQRLGLVAVERSTDGSVSLHGLMAATVKKLAQLQWLAAQIAPGNALTATAGQQSQIPDYMRNLYRACTLYRRACRHMPAAHWARTQELSLRIVLGCVTEPQLVRLWKKAWRGVRWELLGLEHDSRKTRVIALRNSVELCLLASFLPDSALKSRSVATGGKLLRTFCSEAGYHHMEFRSLEQQLNRYAKFFPQVACDFLPDDGKNVRREDPRPNHRTANRLTQTTNESVWAEVRRLAGEWCAVMEQFMPACGSPQGCSCDDNEISY